MQIQQVQYQQVQYQQVHYQQVHYQQVQTLLEQSQPEQILQGQSRPEQTHQVEPERWCQARMLQAGSQQVRRIGRGQKHQAGWELPH